MERLHGLFGNDNLHMSGKADAMAIDLEDSSAMELDKESEQPQKRFPF